MPIYEYECEKCGHHMEAIQKISDAPVSECELCNSGVKKLISQSTFHLKGTGWYVTDYASKSAGVSGAAKSESSEGVKSDSSPSEKSEAKPKSASSENSTSDSPGKKTTSAGSSKKKE
ncbi:MAG TPA: zinc ribbon domain-containing protein [Deltaproteobacteria bacterium]|nr:zinc ribbon domain-containing protein [Deltaproteobacteria bacterium]HIJ40323.1 zinc ribbon domain-containing protein [Deltaproteobacteria bacterium]